MHARITYIIILLVIIFISSCASSVQSTNINSNKIWGFRYSYADSLGSHYRVTNSNRDCFPGFDEFENDYSKVDIKVYNLKGELVYQSTNLNENWICKDTQDSTYKAGIYTYQLIFMTKKEPNNKDTINGQIHLIDQNRIIE